MHSAVSGVTLPPGVSTKQAFEAAFFDGDTAEQVAETVDWFDQLSPEEQERFANRTPADCRRDPMFRRAVSAARRIRPSAAAAPRAIAAARPRERRERHVARSTSGADSGEGEKPEPPSTGRLCAAGCGRPAPPPGKGATCPTCRQKRARAQKRKTWLDLVDEILAAEARIERLVQDRHEAWRIASFAAGPGGDRFLTRDLTEALQEEFSRRARLLAEFRADALSAPRCACGRTVERRNDGGIVCKALVVREDGGLRCLKCGRDGIARLEPFRGRSASAVQAPAPPMRGKTIESQAAHDRRKAVIA
jgi:hypothetical protein